MESLRTLSYLTLCFFFLISCGNRGDKQNGSKEDDTPQLKAKTEFPIQFNYDKDYPKKDIDFKEIADIEYVAFRDKNIVFHAQAASSGISICDSHIVMSNGHEEEVFVFDRSGKIINKFNKRGRGRGEYQNIIALTTDFKNREIFIFDYPLKYKIYVYSLEGEFKRSFDIPQPLWINTVVDYNHEYLLGHFDTAPSSQKTDNLFYYFISKSSGEFTPVEMTPKEYVTDIVPTIIPIGKGGMYVGVGLPVFNIVKNGSEILLSDLGRDTIYMGSGSHELTPFIVKSPPFVNSQEPILVYPLFRTDKYTFIRKAKRIEVKSDRLESRQKVDSKELEIKIFTIDNYTGEIFEPNIIFNDALEKRVFPFDFFHPYDTFQMSRQDLPSNHLVIKCTTIKYLEAYEKGKLSGELKEFVSTLSEEDNDFLAIIKFKE